MEYYWKTMNRSHFHIKNSFIKMQMKVSRHTIDIHRYRNFRQQRSQIVIVTDIERGIDGGKVNKYVKSVFQEKCQIKGHLHDRSLLQVVICHHYFKKMYVEVCKEF